MFSPKIKQDSSFIASDYSHAQPWCNFVLFEPTWLPEEMKILDQQLRPESTTGRSSYRCVFADQTRKLSLKQFLYDWAPPAYDHPSLWRNHKISSIHETPTPRFFFIDNDIAWIGWNFRKQPALSLNIKRTMMEMTAVEGMFTDNELIKICTGLKPVDSTFMDRILATSFAHLCYSHRHSKVASEVPLSYWKYHRQKNWNMNALPISNLKSPQIPSSYGYFLDSIFTFGDSVHETEYYYEHRDVPGSYIRLLMSPHGQKQGIPYPPQIGDQVCKNQIIKIGEKDVHHAYLNPEVGPHEAVWLDENFVTLLLVKPAKWTSFTWFTELIRDIQTVSNNTD